MARSMVGLLVALAVWCLAAEAALAGKRVALVIGNGAYQHVSGLPNPAHDAADMAAALRGIGFEVTDIKDAGKDAFEDALSDFSEAASGAEFAIVFYAGHGIEVDKQNYLIPVDAKLATDRRLRFEALSLDDVLGALEGVKGIRMVLLDACRNNPFAASMTMTVASRAVGRGLSRVEAASGTVISFAAKEGTIASDGDGRNSPFTAALLDNIAKPGLELQFLLREVRDRVLTASNGAQEPFISASLPREAVYLVPPAGGGAAASPPDDPVAADFQLAKDIGTAAAWDAFLARHGNAAGNFHVDMAKAARQKLALNVPPPAKIEPDKVECDGVLLASTGGTEKCLKPGDEFADCNGCPKMVVIPAGSFTMGSPKSEKDRRDEEGPQHEVTIAKPFAVGKFEVTFKEWTHCVDDGGCGGHKPDDHGWGRDRRPVINVSWEDGQRYVEWLSGQTSATYRLLTEAEWEYAARAGATTPFSTGNTITPEQANFDGNFTYNRNKKGKYQEKTIAVGSFDANDFGLHDLHGNVWEWVQDCYQSSYTGAPDDGIERNSRSGCIRVIRGGSWGSGPAALRSAFRSRSSPGNRSSDLGFRLARTF